MTGTGPQCPQQMPLQEHWLCPCTLVSLSRLRVTHTRPHWQPRWPARWPAGPALSELPLSGGSAWPCLPGHPSLRAPFSHLSDHLAD